MSARPAVAEKGINEDGKGQASQVARPTEPSSASENVPDPDEDDLDDLDDMLDEFSTVKMEETGQKPAQPASAAPAGSAEKAVDAAAKDAPTAGDEAFSEEDFAKQLQAGMADLLGELEKSPEMQEQFDDILKKITAVSGEGGSTAPDSSSARPGARDTADASFQETIRRTMERMQTSGEQATAAAAAGEGDDFMSQLLKQMASGELSGEGGDDDFSNMLMGMMEQLTNKDILYEPMKELNEKYPEWFEKNKDATAPEDLKRYEEQKLLVKEIVARFEESSYSDDNAADREYIVDRMQKMQAAGSPPTDLVGDMASAQDVLAGADEQCNPQ